MSKPEKKTDFLSKMLFFFHYRNFYKPIFDSDSVLMYMETHKLLKQIKMNEYDKNNNF